MARVASTYLGSRARTSVRVLSAARRGIGLSRLVDGVIITIILAAVAICVELYFRSESEMSSALAKRQAAEEHLNDLSLRIYKMEHEVEMLRSNPAVIEQFARERFGYVRAGDVVIKLSSIDQSKTGKTGLISGEQTRAENLTPQRSGSYTAGSRF